MIFTNRFSPTGSLTFGPTNNGTTSIQTLASQWQQVLPTITGGPNAGTNPTFTLTGIDRNFSVQLTTGTKPAAGALFTCTWPANYLSANNIWPVIFSAGDNNSAIVISTLPLWLTMTPTGFTVNSGSGKLTANTSYTFNFISCPN